MERCKPVPTLLVHNDKFLKFEGDDIFDPTVYRSLIGSLMCLTTTRPDLMFAGSLFSRFMHAPSQVHISISKRTLRYIKGNGDYGILFKKEDQGKMVGTFSWSSKKKEVATQSSGEAEYIITIGATNQALWLRNILRDLEQNDIKAIVIKLDNKLTISMEKNAVLHGRSKHRNVKFHGAKQCSILFGGQIKMDEAKVSAIKEWEAPPESGESTTQNPIHFSPFSGETRQLTTRPKSPHFFSSF
ncbi:hypothetical protein KY285_012615 [Solanum tuberosum]|nr:hypothetical protein KY285_012615 [Solanum tuberosum]